MSILSISATSRLAVRIVRETGQPTPIGDVIHRLENYGIDTARSRAGIHLAEVIGHIQLTKDAEGATCLRIPTNHNRGSST